MSMNRKSKFSGLFEPTLPVDDPAVSTPPSDDVHVPAPPGEQVRVAAPVEERVQEAMPNLAPARRTPRATVQRTAAQRARSTPAPAAQREQRTGSGKRNNPDYFQATAYIPQALKEEVDIKIIRAKRRRSDLDFSVLMEELLQTWVDSKD